MAGRYRVASKESRTCNGIVFDSKAEMLRYQELYILEMAGVIQYLTLQPVFELQPGYIHKKHGKIRPITYRADFQYTQNGKLVVEDVKGHVTEVFKIKKKMLEYKYPLLDFRVVV